MFQKTRNISNLEDYLEETRRQFHRNGESASEGRIILLPAPLPVVAEAEHPRVPDLIRAKIRAGEECVLDQLRTRFPLQVREQVEREWFSYLGEPFQSYPAGTIVLTRETGDGVFYILFPGLRKEDLRDETSGATFIRILDGERPLYPTPPMHPPPLQKALAAGASAYTITSLSASSSSSITFGWSVPVDPASNEIWWALYQGVMPSWENLDEYDQWNWVSPKGSGYGKTGQQTVGVSMTSGMIYTFALLNDWSLGDYQQLTAP